MKRAVASSPLLRDLQEVLPELGIRPASVSQLLLREKPRLDSLRKLGLLHGIEPFNLPDLRQVDANGVQTRLARLRGPRRSPPQSWLITDEGVGAGGASVAG